jgi:hypothetical protein
VISTVVEIKNRICLGKYEPNILKSVSYCSNMIQLLREHLNRLDLLLSMIHGIKIGVKIGISLKK